MQQSPTLCKGLNISRMQTFVRLPTELDNLLLNAAGYFDVSPNKPLTDLAHYLTVQRRQNAYYICYQFVKGISTTESVLETGVG